MSLDQLQKIRARRLEKQLTEVQQRKEALAHAEQRLQQVQQEVANFDLWRLSQQEALFKNLISQASGVQAVQDYHAQLAQLSEQQQQLQAEIPNAQKQLEQAQQQLAEAKKAATALALKNEKTKEIINIQNTAQQKLEDSKEFTQDP